MAKRVFETTLPLAVRVIGGSFEDVGAVLASSLAQTVLNRKDYGRTSNTAFLV